MNILAIDPGNIDSAYCIWNGNRLTGHGKIPNASLKKLLGQEGELFDTVAVEMIASYGMPVGKEVFDTCLFIGQLMQLCEEIGVKCELVYRLQVKLHLCHDSRAKDSNIRQALIDRFGDKGTKKEKGVTYGLSGDVWSAFAVAVFYQDTKILKPVI